MNSLQRLKEQDYHVITLCSPACHSEPSEETDSHRSSNRSGVTADQSTLSQQGTTGSNSKKSPANSNEGMVFRKKKTMKTKTKPKAPYTHEFEHMVLS